MFCVPAWLWFSLPWVRIRKETEIGLRSANTIFIENFVQISSSQSSSCRTIRRSEDRCTRDICPGISRCVNQPNCPAQPYLHENPRSPGINHPTPATLIYTFTKALVRTATLCWSFVHPKFLYLLSVNTGLFAMNEYLRHLQSTRALRLI